MLTDEEKKILLKTARLSIQERFYKNEVEYPQPTGILKQNCGAFVTLNKHGNLRGCIGYIVAAKPLFETVKEVAKSSAFADRRFPAVVENEIDELEIEISVLSPFKEIDDINEIKVGVHGIMIRRGVQSGLLLPQVAMEYNWDRDTFLTHTCHKAHLPGGAWKSKDVSIEIFSAAVFNEKSLLTGDDEDLDSFLE